MAWCRGLLSCIPLWRKVLGRNSTDEDGRSEDDLTSLSDKMPAFEERITVSTVREIASGCLMPPSVRSLLQWSQSALMTETPASVTVIRTPLRKPDTVGLALSVFRIKVRLVL